MDGTLDQVDDSIQAQILGYEISVDLLIDLPDSEVLDVFSRLNSYAVVLNEQEKLNATHFGPFKALADRIGHKYFDYWTQHGIFTPQMVMRMSEVQLVADLLVAILKGIRPKKEIKKSYAEFEKDFDHDCEELEAQFDNVLHRINDVYPEGLRQTEYRRPHVFYSLFTAFFHALYRLPELDAAAPVLNDTNTSKLRNRLEGVEALFVVEDVGELQREDRQFLEDSRRATTDGPVRKRRTEFLLKRMRGR